MSKQIPTAHPTRTTPFRIRMDLQQQKLASLTDRLNRSQDVMLNFIHFLGYMAIQNAKASGYHFKLREHQTARDSELLLENYPIMPRQKDRIYARTIPPGQSRKHNRRKSR